MKRITGITIILAALLLISQTIVYSQNYFADTVWTKITDQSQGFWKVKFSNNDSIIVGNGYEFIIFYNALNGEEIFRMPGKSSVFFIDNDRKFIRANNDRSNFEIFDTKSFLLIDTLRNDGIHSSASVDISYDEKYLLTNIPYGFRIFDLATKQILKNKIYPQEPNLIYSVIDYVFFVCNYDFIIHRVRTYEDPNHRGDVNYYKTIGQYNKINFTTLDSTDNFGNSRGMMSSNHCNYYTMATGDPTYGVEIYDFNTKQLLHRLPINGPSLTGIEFSPDDKYIVTSNGPGANSLIIWDVMTGNQIHRYWPSSHSNIDISHNGKYIISNVGNSYLRLFFSRFAGTPVPVIPDDVTKLYPNPTTGDVNIDNIATVKVKIYYTNGVIQTTINPINSENGIRFNVSNLPNGEYLISIEGKENKTYKLIINK